MKKRVLLTTATAAIAAFTLTSYDNGPIAGGAGNRTGSGGTTATCSGTGCHSANTSATTLTVALAFNGSPATSYVPGRAYTVTIGAVNTSSSLSKFGFQLSSVKAGATSTQAGTFAAGSTPNIAVRTSGGLSIVEHTSPIATLGSGAYGTSFTWTAPAAGTGTVRFFAIANVVNNNGTVSGDAPNAGTFDFPEATTSVSNVASNISLKAFPSPVTDKLQLEIGGAAGKSYTASIVDMSGRVVKVLSITEEKTTVDVASLAAGHYSLSVTGAEGRGNAHFVKQ